MPEEPSPIHWHTADAYWSPDGYSISFELWLEQRAAGLFAEGLDARLEKIDPEIAEQINATITPGRKYQEGDSYGFQEGRVLLSGPREMFDLDPKALRRELDELALWSRQRADELQISDEELVGGWLDALGG